MDAKMFAWAYMIQNGVGGVRRSYYGGYECLDPEIKRFDPYSHKFYDNIRKHYNQKIRTVGINWDRTAAPEHDTVNVFQGTFCDSKPEPIMIGTLVMNDGSQINWTCDAIESSTVFEMMAKANQIEAEFIDLTEAWKR